MSITQIASVFSKLVNTTDMGLRINAWLFSLLFTLLVVLLYGRDLPTIIGQFFSILKNSTGVDGGALTAIAKATNGNVVPSGAPPLASGPLNPLPNSHFFNGIPLPSWALTLGVFIWALAVMWEIWMMLRGGQSLKKLAWGWLIAPVTLLAFVLAPVFGGILDKDLYSPLMLHFIVGVQNSVGIQGSGVDPKTLGNPLWLLTAMFGVAKPNGGINLWGVLTNATMGLFASVTTTITDLVSGDPMEAISAILQHILSPSIVIEIIILLEAIFITLEGTLQMLFFWMYPLFSIVIVTNPFSFDRIVMFLKTSLRVLAGIALIMTTDLVLVGLNYQVMQPKSAVMGAISNLFGGWFLSVINILVLAVAIWIIYVVGVRAILDLIHRAAQEVQVAGVNLGHALYGRPVRDSKTHLPVKNEQGEIQFEERNLPPALKTLAKYGGNVLENWGGRVSDFVDPTGAIVAQEKPYTMGEVQDKILYEYDKPQIKQYMTFDNENTAERVMTGVLNHRASFDSSIPDGTFERHGSQITYTANNPKVNQLVESALRDFNISNQPEREINFENRDVAQRVWSQLNNGNEDVPFKLNGSKITYPSGDTNLGNLANAVLGDKGNLVKRSFIQQERSINFNNSKTAEWVWKLLKNEGNLNRALADHSVSTGGDQDGNFKVRGNTIIFAAGDDRTQKVVNGVLSSLKTYHYVFGKYIDENGNSVPEDIAKRGIVL